MSWVLATIDVDSGCVLRFFDFGAEIGDPYPSTAQFHPVHTDQIIVSLSDGSVLNLCTLTGRELYLLVSPCRRAKIQREAWPIETFESVEQNVSSGSTSVEGSSSSDGGVKKKGYDEPGDKQNSDTVGTSSISAKYQQEPEELHRASILSPDGALLFVGIAHHVIVFDVLTRTVLLRQNVRETPLPLSKANCVSNVVGLTIDRGGQLLVVNVSHRVLRVYGVLIEASANPRSGNESGDKRGRNGVTLVWTGIDLLDAVDRRTFRVHEPVVCGKCIVAASIDHHKIYIWEASSGRHLNTISDHWRSDEKRLGVVSLATHPERILFASCAIDGTVCFWCPPVSQKWLIQMQGYVELFENQQEPQAQGPHSTQGYAQADGETIKAERNCRTHGEDEDVCVFRRSTEKQSYFISACPRFVE